MCFLACFGGDVDTNRITAMILCPEKRSYAHSWAFGFKSFTIYPRPCWDLSSFEDPPVYQNIAWNDSDLPWETPLAVLCSRGAGGRLNARSGAPKQTDAALLTDNQIIAGTIQRPAKGSHQRGVCHRASCSRGAVSTQEQCYQVWEREAVPRGHGSPAGQRWTQSTHRK